MPEHTDPGFLLDWVHDLRSTHPFFDFHVHPYDVLSGDVNYPPNKTAEGVYTKGSSSYHPPAIGSNLELSGSKPLAGSNLPRALLLASRLAYTHTGAKVFTDHLELVGLSGALLLPVARIPGDAEQMLNATEAMFPDDRLIPGCAFPVGKSPDEIADFYRLAQDKNKICAIKLHPNLAGLNPLDQKAHELIEATLMTAGSLNLIVVVHGGRTPGLEPADSRENGTLSRLATVNWGLSSAPVTIAHAGCYGLAEEEIIATLTQLNQLLTAHPNLMVDTSNLEPVALKSVLERVDRSRLIFGSDALYIPIWKAWLRFLDVLRQVSSKPEDDLICIASLNPKRCLDATSKPVLL